MLIIHNELDYRLPVSEGLAMFNVLQTRGVPSKLVMFPDENHVRYRFAKTNNLFLTNALGSGFLSLRTLWCGTARSWTLSTSSALPTKNRKQTITKYIPLSL